MLKIAALILASAAGALGATTAAASASPTPDSTLMANASWWEKVTVTLGGDGNPEACRYESSLSPAKAEDCDVGATPAAAASKEAGDKGEITRITFERRFTPGAAPAKPNLQVGDTLLGGQIMSLAIDAKGAVKACKIVAASGSMRPEYGCDDAQAEKFQASFGGPRNADQEGYMTILVYGHSEHMA